jgi:restriction system protein
MAMARRRGFFAELQHQAKVAAREAERQQRAAVREHNAAMRRAEQARKAEERAIAQAARAAAAEKKRLEKEAKAAHVAAKEAEVEELNSRIAEIYDEIDGLLAATLDVDDYVDLDKLRRTVQHPQFDRGDLESPIPLPEPIPDPPEPVFTPPEPPKGFFGSKKKHAKAVAAAEAAHARAHAKWRAKVDWVSTRRKDAADEHAQAEKDRIATLEQERARYQAECAAREAEVNEQNSKIDALITNLGYGTVDAVQEYVSIVLSNSVYPEHFPVDHDFTFDPSTAELRIRVLVPPPSEVPDIKAYKYTKSTDEITATALSQKASKDRYSGAVHQVALRSLHEIFEADRRGLIKTISLEVGTETTSPATGKQAYVPFVAVAAERDTFLDFDLSAVVPAATLDHLGAAVSKNPYGLVAADTTGVRRS